jgi:adenine-specific DNA methylase
MQLVPLREDGTPDVESLNQGFSKDYLENPKNPRWIAKAAVAYLWARTVRCKNCRATIPLLKTRWLAKKANKRVLLTMTPNADRTGVAFGIEHNVPAIGGNNAQKREHDRRLGQGTMASSGAWCPCCGKPGTVSMEREDVSAAAGRGELGRIMTAVVVDGPAGKEYRLPTPTDIPTSSEVGQALANVFESIPFGVPTERISPGGSRATGGASVTVHKYGMERWAELYTERQLLALGQLVGAIRSVSPSLSVARYVSPNVQMRPLRNV